jgi:hypothetical protein
MLLLLLLLIVMKRMMVMVTWLVVVLHMEGQIRQEGAEEGADESEDEDEDEDEGESESEGSFALAFGDGEEVGERAVVVEKEVGEAGLWPWVAAADTGMGVAAVVVATVACYLYSNWVDGRNVAGMADVGNEVHVAGADVHVHVAARFGHLLYYNHDHYTLTMMMTSLDFFRGQLISTLQYGLHAKWEVGGFPFKLQEAKTRVKKKKKKRKRGLGGQRRTKRKLANTFLGEPPSKPKQIKTHALVTKIGRYE